MPKSPPKKRSNKVQSLAKSDGAADHGNQPTMKSTFQGIEDSSMTKRPLYPIFEASEDVTMDEDAVEEVAQHVEKKRRLSVEQVKSLEKHFEVENKLEPERKLQLARELGLQPRQVAVWFQNRRARWKTKQLEKDYDLLRASLDTLKSDYTTLLHDKEKLESEVQRLKNMLGSSSDGTSKGDSGNMKIKLEDAEEGENLSRDEELSVVNNTNSCSKNIINEGSSSKSKDNFSSSDSDDSEILDEDSPHHPNTRIPGGSNNETVSNKFCTFDVLSSEMLECHNLDDPYVKLFPIQGYCSSSARPKLEDNTCFQYESTTVPSSTSAGGGFMSLEEDQDQGWWEWS